MDIDGVLPQQRTRAEQLLGDKLLKCQRALSSSSGEGFQEEAGLGPEAQKGCHSGVGWGELQEEASMSGGQMHRPRAHSTSHMLPVVIMATVAMIIENFQKTRMLDIIYRVF